MSDFILDSELAENPDFIPIPATKGIRLANFIIDRIIITILSYAVGASLPLDTYIDPTMLYVQSLIIGIFLTVFYYSFMESYFGKSVGKFVTGTTVIKQDGTRPTFINLFGRSFARFIPFEPVSFLFGERGWHDTLSDTYVVKDSDLNVSMRSDTV